MPQHLLLQVRMVFRQHKLQYDPPLEELRIRHYKDNLNTFLGLPLRLVGNDAAVSCVCFCFPAAPVAKQPVL
jgi:hypothetical protein